MAETDLLWMTLVVFIPTIFALGLVFFPRGSEESMRWWTLFGTALALGASLGMFFEFRQHTVERQGVTSSPEAREAASLSGRSRDSEFAAPGAVARADDWV